MRAAILSLPFLAAAVFSFPRIQSVFHRLRFEQPALITRVRQSIESSLQARAAIEMEDDFTSGLSGWDFEAGGSGDWTFDQAHLVRPGKLALLRASRPLTNYKFKFAAFIEKRSLGWAFRASDFKNYYAMKITVTKSGPLSRAVLMRYTVMNGAPADRAQFPLPVTIQNDRVYRVETSAYQDRFITSVNGKVVDTFLDRRHLQGGVGLFGGPGEDARILRVRVADRDDLFGRICAYFSKHSADSSAGLPRLSAVPENGAAQIGPAPTGAVEH